jgi:hypothetical protein
MKWWNSLGVVAALLLAAPGAFALVSASPSAPLSWAPPPLLAPEFIAVPNTDGRVIMDPSKDYVVDLDHLSACGGLWLEGGRNVVVIGGRVTIPGMCAGAYDRTAVKVRANSGIVHLEGLLVDGPFTHDGIVTASPHTTLQVENVRIESVRTQDANHPDCLQTQGGLGGLRVDRFTCTTQLQGFFLKVEDGKLVGFAEIRNTNIIGDPGKHLFFQTSPDIPVILSKLWLHTDVPWASFGFYVYPQRDGRTLSGGYDRTRRSVVSTDGKRLWFVGSNIKGIIHRGRPRGGDIVPADSVGTSYVSPGYKNQIE